MGQQQLLLVILVTIIVGIATVVAINTFGTAADQANIDAVNNDVATLASAAQGFYMRPAMLGGGGRSFNTGGPDNTGVTFRGLAFPSIGISENGLTVENENGRYILSDRTADSFRITAYPASGVGYTPGTVAERVLSPGANGDREIIALVGPNSFELNPAE
jgi:type II secretory pathway pseudopilin PulG